MAIMYLSNENFTCPKEQKMHKELKLLKKWNQISMENSVDPDQLAALKPADLDLHCFQYNIALWVHNN